MNVSDLPYYPFYKITKSKIKYRINIRCSEYPAGDPRYRILKNFIKSFICGEYRSRTDDLYGASVAL